MDKIALKKKLFNLQKKLFNLLKNEVSIVEGLDG